MPRRFFITKKKDGTAVLVGGAALGAAFGEFFKAVMEAKDTVSEFRPQFDKLSSTLERIHPIFDDIESFNKVLNRVGEMDRIQEMMTQGVKLVETSAKVGKVNFIRKSRYSKKLGELNKSMEEFFTVDAQAVIVRNGKEILVEVQRLSQELKMLTNTWEEIYANGSMAESGGGYFVDYLGPQAPEVMSGGDAGYFLAVPQAPPVVMSRGDAGYFVDYPVSQAPEVMSGGDAGYFLAVPQAPPVVMSRGDARYFVDYPVSQAPVMMSGRDAGYFVDYPVPQAPGPSGS